MMHVVRLLTLVAAAATILAVPANARAYCRTTTVPIPAGYDPTASGCITEGTPLAWPSMPVTYELQEQASTQIPLAEAIPILDRSFAKWAQASCGGGDASRSPSVSFADRGPTDAGFTPCEAGPCGYTPEDAPHVVIFRDAAWPYNDPANTLALTTVTFGVDTGHIYAADMEINSHEHTISTSVPPPSGAFSLEAIVTHEAGHFVGIAHSAIDTAVMFAHYQPDAIALTADDVAAVCAIYPPSNGVSSGGCSCVEAKRAKGTTALALASFGVIAAGIRRRRRTSRRVP
jgi:matrixin